MTPAQGVGSKGGSPMFRKSWTMLAAAALLVFGPGSAMAEKQVLRMAYWTGPSHQMVQTLAAWIKTIEEASGGNLTVELDKAALGKMEAQYDLIKNGVRDMVWAVPGYTVGRFDLVQDAELPHQRAGKGASRSTGRPRRAGLRYHRQHESLRQSDPGEQGGADEGRRRGRRGADREGLDCGRRTRTRRREGTGTGH